MRGRVQLIDLPGLPESPTIRSQHLVQSVGKVVGKELFHPLPDSFSVGDGKDLFERPIQPGDTAIQIDGHQTDIDRLDD